jgi:predicted SAM-dependent methyltransferase
MEHFTHDEIDQVMREFHRVLRPGGRIILLWPGTDSIPQKMLRLVEKVINLRKKREKFHFHPDEISQLRSSREGRDVLLRNRFRVLTVNYGFRSLMAFKILVGEKD